MRGVLLGSILLFSLQVFETATSTIGSLRGNYSGKEFHNWTPSRSRHEVQISSKSTSVREERDFVPHLKVTARALDANSSNSTFTFNMSAFAGGVKPTVNMSDPNQSIPLGSGIQFVNIGSDYLGIIYTAANASIEPSDNSTLYENSTINVVTVNKKFLNDTKKDTAYSDTTIDILDGVDVLPQIVAQDQLTSNWIAVYSKVDSNSKFPRFYVALFPHDPVPAVSETTRVSKSSDAYSRDPTLTTTNGNRFLVLWIKNDSCIAGNLETNGLNEIYFQDINVVCFDSGDILSELRCDVLYNGSFFCLWVRTRPSVMTIVESGVISANRSTMKFQNISLIFWGASPQNRLEVLSIQAWRYGHYGAMIKESHSSNSSGMLWLKNGWTNASILIHNETTTYPNIYYGALERYYNGLYAIWTVSDQDDKVYYTKGRVFSQDLVGENVTDLGTGVMYLKSAIDTESRLFVLMGLQDSNFYNITELYVGLLFNETGGHSFGSIFEVSFPLILVIAAMMIFNIL